MTARLLIVVSGLAASGKTTVGRALGAGLSLPLLDKDDILEALFDSLGCEDRDRRQQLSRASDDVLFRVAAPSPCCLKAEVRSRRAVCLAVGPRRARLPHLRDVREPGARIASRRRLDSSRECRSIDDKDWL